MLSLLFPHFALLHVSAISVLGTTLRMSACCTAPTASCSGCGAESGRVHSRYVRTVVDAAVGGQNTVIKLTVRRFFCNDGTCPKTTFAEQVPQLTFRYGRSTLQLRRLREHVALALAGRAGARLTEAMAVGVSRDSMLRLVRALPDPQVGPVRVLGVDDFALKKGNVYGTVLVDVETGQAIDVLPERTADALVTWLQAHESIEVICRDRGGCYSEGATRGAPAAIQVADRWHLWSNFGKACENAVRRLRSAWVPPAPEPTPVHVPDAPNTVETVRIRELHAAVHALGDKGVKVGRIALELRIDRKTARKYLHAAVPEELIRGAIATRRTVLDDHAQFLARRWSEGCDSGEKLHAELAERGITVSERTVRRFLNRMRADAAPTTKPPIPKVREVTTLVLTRPSALSEDDTTLAEQLRDRCPDLDVVFGLAEAFGEMLVDRTGKDNLEDWAKSATTSGVTELANFAAGLGKDWDAVLAGLSLPWSSGVIEGHVNRIKMLKRQMFGRAKPDLLRKRVLLAN